MNSDKNHWDKIYTTKQANEVSWTQEIPTTSLDFFHRARLGKQAPIIDVGGGDSKFVDFLLEEGYKNISVLDISEQALLVTKQRLGDKAINVNWIVSDINDFVPTIYYDFWHDRATFHFLINAPQILKYISIARQAVRENGIVTIGTFSTDGPETCSGLHIKQYNEETLFAAFADGFKKLVCESEDHITPFNTTQNFLFCSFKRCLN